MIKLFYNYDNNISAEEMHQTVAYEESATVDSSTTLLRNIKGDILGLRSMSGTDAEAYFSEEAPNIDKLWDFATFRGELTDKAGEVVYTFDLEKQYPGILKLLITNELQQGVYYIKLYMDIPRECNYYTIIKKDTVDLTVDLDFSEGDLVYERPRADQAFRTITITCPEELKPENIVKGITIAGVTGTYEPKKAKKKHHHKKPGVSVEPANPLDPSFGIMPDNFVETDKIRVEGITPGCVGSVENGTIVITAQNTELEYSDVDYNIGRNLAGWWAGIKVIIKDTELAKRLQYMSGATSHSTAKSFYANRDSGADEPVWMGMWGCIADDYLELLSSEKRQFNYYWNFDLDEDGVYEQQVILRLDVPSIRLIGHDPEYVSFDDEDDYEEETTTDTPVLVDDSLLDPGFLIDSESTEEPSEEEELPRRKVTIVYDNEDCGSNMDPTIDTYLIFAGKGAMLSVE